MQKLAFLLRGMEEFSLSHIFAGLVFLLMWGLLICLCYVFCWIPERNRLKLRRQGIKGPLPSIILGNTPEIKRFMTQNSVSPEIGADCFSTMFPYFKLWTKTYGRSYMFSMGRLQFLYVSDPDMVKKIKQFRSLDLGKPAYLQKERGAIVGKGVIASNGTVWSHQRKAIGPQLYVDKVKGLLNPMMEYGSTLIKSWERIIEAEGGIADIMVDNHVRSFTSNVIAKLIFGHDHDRGVAIVSKSKAYINTISSMTTLGVPLLRFLPTKGNREMWRFKKEVHSMIMDIAKSRSSTGSTCQDMLQVVLEGSKSCQLGPLTSEEFVVDNCKNVFLAASEVTALAAMWGLMLLGSHPEWQARARSEVLEVCRGNFPDSDMLSKMKVLKMVIQEVLRLYPAASFASRQALQDLNLGDLQVPEGVIIWIWIVALHHDPELWGPDVNKFNPERFVNGVSGACKSPEAYLPFGVGARICPGQNLAMTELTVLFALILSKFKLAISPNYRHSPKFSLFMEPEYGVNLLIEKI